MNEIVCTGNDFKGLTNPYTGKPLTVMMRVGTGTPLFHAVDTYSTSDHFPTSNDAYRAWDRADGIEGIEGPKSEIKCRYTGEILRMASDEFGWYMTGGFDPKIYTSKDNFLYRATMRDGVSKFPPPPSEESRVSPVPRVEMSAKRKNATRGVQLSDEAVERAAASMQLHKDEFAPSDTVSMHVPDKKARAK